MMKYTGKYSREQIIHWVGVVIAGLFIGLLIQFARAWTEPTEAPPEGNVGAPINTSSNIQVKMGPLGVNSNGMGNVATQGLNVGGKAIADDFCLRTGVCLSSGGGGGDSVHFLEEEKRNVLFWTIPNYCNNSWSKRILDVSPYVPSTAKGAILRLRCGASWGTARRIGSSVDPGDERIVGCRSGNNLLDAVISEVTLSPDKKFEFFYRSQGCTSWNIVTLIGYVE